ncbi:hypothetical protein E1B28_000821 [Marasmius oreades]|uniref:Transcription factor tau subunit sfc3/Tfc3 C-terminal domain-containing protein n=1 Tax=Marasmius oreades TaxID=181124 RepID=A0A9P7V280_9AGAR|nr:uncharacterized protein E1B28_000821 [Marasmius oreades]KAG7098926.1 hypothetical protein E1B28_000821 [Marasmius oreades]
MDELLNHCLGELAFDGDLGCSVSRLSTFVRGFYESHPSVLRQNVDDAFCAFVWSLIVQQPTVSVGQIPDGVTSEVWIAPQTSAKRKANARGEVHVETQPRELNIVPDAKIRPLEELQAEYGEKLRIACNRDAIYASITGSHIRFSKLSPMVYSALQIITRGREAGVTVVELGAQSSYDQKTCFYLVKQLLELNLVIKRRRGGVGTHYVIHRYIYDRSPSWKAIRDEERKAELQLASSEFSGIDDEEEEQPEPVISPDFSPLDARHLSSLPLVRARVVKLLKASKNYMHVSTNMILTLGFSNPTKTDRRFFSSRIRDLVRQGVIEKVIVPSQKKRTNKASNVLCLRLLDENAMGGNEVEDLKQVDEDKEADTEELVNASGVKTNVTIHRQIIELLEESGTRGLTLNELSSALDNFDKRTIELLLNRAEKVPPPSHLSDLGITGLLETNGRERRHRYFTVSAYRNLLDRENLDKSTAGLSEMDLSNRGNFLPVDPSAFYENEETDHRYLDGLRGDEPIKNKTTAKSCEEVIKSQKRKFQYKDDVLQSSESHRPTKKRQVSVSGAEDVRSETQYTSVPKKPGRLRNFDVLEATESVIAPEPRKRGRPRKNETSSASIKRGCSRKSNTAAVLNKNQVRDGNEAAEEERAPEEGIELRPSESGETNAIEGPPIGDTPNGESVSAPVSMKFGRPGKDTRPYPYPTQEKEVSVSIGQCYFPNTKTAVDRSEARVGHVDEVTEEEGREEPVEEVMPVFPECGQTSTVENRSQIATELTSVRRSSQLREQEADAIECSPKAVDTSDDGLEPVQTPTPVPFEEVQLEVPDPSQVQSQRLPTPTVQLTKGKSTSAKVNVSSLRRENELLRVLEVMGGIANIHGKELYDTHMALVESLAKASETTSTPVGARIDKRTVVRTFNTLESRGKVKQLTASLTAQLGMSRSVVIAYLPSLEDSKLNGFLASLGRVPPPAVPQAFGRKLDQPLEYGSEVSRTSKGPAPLQILEVENPIAENERWRKNTARADELFSRDEDAVRSVLLAERSTLGQLYGTIISRVLRARELHLIVLGACEGNNTSPQIVSHEKRIIHLSFLTHDLPLVNYIKVVPPIEHSEEAFDFLRSEGGANTIVRDLPANLLAQLQIGRSRARSRILDSLEILRSLNLVSPLVPSTSQYAWTCSPQGDHPATFDVVPLESNALSPTMAPAYWGFNDLGPIYHWAASEIQPPFICDVPINSLAQGCTYWSLLRDASSNPHLEVLDPTPQSSTGRVNMDANVARSLRRRASWESDYILTWHQIRYLKRFTDDLDVQDVDAKINRIAWVISAPSDVVSRYYGSAQMKLVKQQEKTRKRESVARKERMARDAKASLAKKAEEARKQREIEWDLLVKRVHPDPFQETAATRIKRVRTRFLQLTAGKDTQKWENEILAAVQEAEVIAKKVLKGKMPITRNQNIHPPQPTAVGAPPVATNPPEKSVGDLIAEQGPPLPRTRPPPKKRRKTDKADTEESMSTIKSPTRRHRFQWNRDFEELARDASAIIKARCRDVSRLDWGAYEQVFPTVPRNTVRQRVARIRENPANDAYLNRLEDRWYELWVQHRGTVHLPDIDPTSPTNFNLIEHIEFLRKHIDKSALRVGYAQQPKAVPEVLLNSLELMEEQYDVIETGTTGPTWEFAWNAAVEEGREKRMLTKPFTKTPDILLFGEAPAEAVYVAESALKMALGTPVESYDPERAAFMLHKLGEDVTSVATKNLLGQGVLSKLVRDPSKAKPGRQLKISDINQNSLNGNIQSDVFHDAASLKELSAQQEGEWREWPLLATDGDSAALIQLISDDKVDIRIDTSGPQRFFPAFDWNSKKADDDHIETALHVRFHDLQDSAPLGEMDVDQTPEEYNATPNHVHGMTTTGEEGCCSKNGVRGIVSCGSCLEELWTARQREFDQKELHIAQLVLWLVDQAEAGGVTKEELVINIKTPLDELLPVVGKLLVGPHPAIYWAGYTSPVLVAPAHMTKWTVVIQENPLMRMLPRRWMSPCGLKTKEIWEAGLRAVVGGIVFRPGISMYELRWRLRLVYDRQEICDLLRFLQDNGTINNRFMTAAFSGTLDSVMLPGAHELQETQVFWFLENSKDWFLLYAN